MHVQDSAALDSWKSRIGSKRVDVLAVLEPDPQPFLTVLIGRRPVLWVDLTDRECTKLTRGSTGAQALAGVLWIDDSDLHGLRLVVVARSGE